MNGCRVRHRYRAKFHDAGLCVAEPWPHLHVECRRCSFAWIQPTLFMLAG